MKITQKEIWWILAIYAVSFTTGLFELLPLNIIFITKIALKKKKIAQKILISLILPIIYFSPLLLWIDMKWKWYVIPVGFNITIYIIFFFLSEKILKFLRRSNKKNNFIISLTISSSWIFSCLVGKALVGIDLYWMFFSYYWFRSILARLNIYIFEFIIFFILSYITILLSSSQKNKNEKNVALILIILLIITFFIPIKIPHKINAVLINLNLDFSYTHRVEHLNEIINKYIETIKKEVNNNTDIVILPEYVITKDWRFEKEVMKKFKDISNKTGVPILVGSIEYKDSSRFYNVALYITPSGKVRSLKDAFPMILSTNILRGRKIPTIKLKNETYAIMLCFPSTQLRFWKEIKNNKKIKGVFILANEQALHLYLKRMDYYMIQYYERYCGKPVYKVANQGFNYPEEMSNSPNRHYLLSEIFH